MYLPRHRQLYLWVAIVIFITATPLIIFYAKGDRFDTNSGQFVKTGIFSLSSQPRSVTVSIGGKHVIGRTPLQVRSLLPGRYTVEISKDGFQTWKKSLIIAAGQTTFLDDVVLVRNPVETQTLPVEHVLASAISPDKRTILVAGTQDGVTVLTRLSASGDVMQTLQLTQATTVSGIDFSPTGRKALLATAAGHFVVATDLRSSPVRLEDITPGPWLDLVWNTENENEIFGGTTEHVERIDTFAKKSTIVIEENAADIMMSGNQLFVVASPKGGLQVLQRKNSSEAVVTLATLPLGTWQFLSNVGPRLMLHNNDGQVAIFTRDGQRVEDPAFTSFTVPNNLVWSPSEERFATVVGNEVWLGAPRVADHQLVGRFSDPPLSVAFFLTDQSLFFIYEDRIVVTDVDGQDPNNASTIVQSAGHIQVIGSLNEGRELLVLEHASGQLVRLILQ